VSAAALERTLEHARAGRAEAEAALLEELRIPSVSTLPAHRADVRRNCEWLAGRFRSLGFEVSVTDVSDGGHPVLQADHTLGGGAPSLTIYGHYDVQPPDPLELWESPPFEPGAHSPNEHFSLDHFHRGTEALLRFFWSLGEGHNQ
jgi:acetylornithine deacetylase/succinyl-diaminopimelate desuccinylase-like protein